MDAGLRLELAGRRAVVTGGSRGVGRAVARLLAAAGADVGIGYRSRGAEAEAVVRDLRSLGVRSWAEGGDLAVAADAERLFRRAEEEFRGVDLAVANAGVWPPDPVPIAEMEERQWRSTMEANLTSVFHTVRRAARDVADGGRIVLISSTAAQRGEAYHADYAASKGALVSLTKSVALEVAARGVTVNCVAPGWIDTDMVESAFAGAGRGEIERGIPLGRVATPDDVAGAVVFLCSTLARHVTGEVLNVNGGSVLCG